MPFVPVPKLSVALCREVPEAWFVFGDNCLGRGEAGQACIRREPNAIGVQTKWAPALSEGAFFRDRDLLILRPSYDKVFGRLEQLIRDGRVVCWPQADVGTGLAQLPTRAPKVYAYITERRNILIELARERG